MRWPGDVFDQQSKDEPEPPLDSVRDAVERLPPELRSAVEGVFYGQMPKEECGRLDGVGRTTINDRLRRAFEALREDLQGQIARGEVPSAELARWPVLGALALEGPGDETGSDLRAEGDEEDDYPNVGLDDSSTGSSCD